MARAFGRGWPLALLLLASLVAGQTPPAEYAYDPATVGDYTAFEDSPPSEGDAPAGPPGPPAICRNDAHFTVGSDAECQLKCQEKVDKADGQATILPEIYDSEVAAGTICCKCDFNRTPGVVQPPGSTPAPEPPKSDAPSEEDGGDDSPVPPEDYVPLGGGGNEEDYPDSPAPGPVETLDPAEFNEPTLSELIVAVDPLAVPEKDSDEKPYYTVLKVLGTGWTLPLTFDKVLAMVYAFNNVTGQPWQYKGDAWSQPDVYPAAPNGLPQVKLAPPPAPPTPIVAPAPVAPVTPDPAAPVTPTPAAPTPDPALVVSPPLARRRALHSSVAKINFVRQQAVLGGRRLLQDPGAPPAPEDYPNNPDYIGDGSDVTATEENPPYEYTAGGDPLADSPPAPTDGDAPPTEESPPAPTDEEFVTTPPSEYDGEYGPPAPGAYDYQPPTSPDPTLTPPAPTTEPAPPAPVEEPSPSPSPSPVPEPSPSPSPVPSPPLLSAPPAAPAMAQPGDADGIWYFATYPISDSKGAVYGNALSKAAADGSLLRFINQGFAPGGFQATGVELRFYGNASDGTIDLTKKLEGDLFGGSAPVAPAPPPSEEKPLSTAAIAGIVGGVAAAAVLAAVAVVMISSSKRRQRKEQRESLTARWKLERELAENERSKLDAMANGSAFPSSARRASNGAYEMGPAGTSQTDLEVQRSQRRAETMAAAARLSTRQLGIQESPSTSTKSAAKAGRLDSMRSALGLSRMSSAISKSGRTPSSAVAPSPLGGSGDMPTPTSATPRTKGDNLGWTVQRTGGGPESPIRSLRSIHSMGGQSPLPPPPPAAGPQRFGSSSSARDGPASKPSPWGKMFSKS